MAHKRNRGRRRNKLDVVQQLRRMLRWRVERIFTEAAAWARKQFGQRLKAGYVRHQARIYGSKRKVPDFVQRYALQTLPSPA